MKILMRMSMSPFDNLDLYTVASQDRIGTNIGNMLFPYSIMRSLYNSDANEKVEIVGYRNIKPEDADMINSEYDMFVIPLANAFRNDFIIYLDKITKLVKKLTIPCVVVGVGTQMLYEPDFSVRNEFDESAYEFMKAVLEKSHSVGVRGEITATYLKKLGFSNEHVEIIGCPSMYMHGEFLPLKRSIDITDETVVSMNYNDNYLNVYRFLERVKKEYPNYYMIPQNISELRLLYAGISIKGKYLDNPYYIKNIEYNSYINDHIRMFINVPSWIKFMEKVDVTVGSRIHGGIASVLAGNPTMIFATDSRVRELAEYHNLPVWKSDDIDDHISLKELYDKTDFSKVLHGHKERYEHYLNFMKRNGIKVQKCGWSKNTPFDKKMKTIELNEPKGVKGYIHLSYEEQIEHLRKYDKFIDGKINWWNRQNKTEEEKNAGLKSWLAAKKEIQERIEQIR